MLGGSALYSAKIWGGNALPHPPPPLTPLQLELFTTEFQAIYWTLHALCLRVSHLMNDFLSFGSAVATNYGVTFIFQTNLNFHEKPQFYVTSSQPVRFQLRTSLEINETLNLPVSLWGGLKNNISSPQK